MSGDSFYNKVTLLLAGDAFTDLSRSQCAMTHGDVKVSSAYPGPFPYSFEFSKTLTGLPFVVTVPQNAVIAQNTDFTIEFGGYFKRTPMGNALFSHRVPNSNANGLLIGMDANGFTFVRATYQGRIVIAINSPVAILEGYHTFSITRVGAQWYYAVDGILQIDLNHNSTWNGAIDQGPYYYLGCDPYIPAMVGALQQVRVTIGAGRYTTSYSPSIIGFPPYTTDPNQLFSNLVPNITIPNSIYTGKVILPNIDTASVQALSVSNNPVGSSWSIARTNSGVPDEWVITGNVPNILSSFLIKITGTTYIGYGAIPSTKSYPLYVTASGTMSDIETLLYNKSVALWLDPSDATTVSTSSGNITSIVDKAASNVFTPVVGSTNPTLSALDFGINGIKLPTGSTGGLSTNVPTVVSDSNGNSIVFLVGKYVGAVSSPVAGLFQLASTSDSTLMDGVVTWSIDTTNNVAGNATISMYDNNTIQDKYYTSTIIHPGDKFIAVWNTANNSLEIRLNQVTVSATFQHNSSNAWAPINSAIGFIGAAETPNGSFVSVGEVIAIPGILDRNSIEKIESYLNHKWNLYSYMPYAFGLSTQVGYTGNQFRATVLVYDVTSVSVSASAGSGWSITPSVPAVANSYTILGTLPNTPTTVTLTLTETNSGSSKVNTDVYSISVIAPPDAPVIYPPDNMFVPINTVYDSLIQIVLSNPGTASLSVNSNAGSGWSIASATGYPVGMYFIRGTTPGTIGPITLNVTASQTSLVTNQTVSVTQSFTINVVATPIQYRAEYPLDLTGMLGSNLITGEQQVLTMSNGPDHQVIIPLNAPYFGNSLLLNYYDSDNRLCTATRDVDYQCTYELTQDSGITASPVFSVITVMNPAITGVVTLSYQCLGGDFSYNRSKIHSLIANQLINGRAGHWDNVLNKPTYYPPSQHLLNVENDSVGYAAMVSAINTIASAVTLVPDPVDLNPMLVHANWRTNVHDVTNFQLQLGNVQNFPLASIDDALLGTSNEKYLTVKAAAAVLAVQLPIAVANPSTQGVTKLNSGLLAGDDYDSTKALTAAGAIALATSQSANAWSNLFPKDQLAVTCTPRVLQFPLWWKGIQYNDINSFLNGIMSYIRHGRVKYDQSNCIFYFPLGTTIPDMTVTFTNPNVLLGKRSVKTPVNHPLRTFMV